MQKHCNLNKSCSLPILEEEKNVYEATWKINKKSEFEDTESKEITLINLSALDFPIKSKDPLHNETAKKCESAIMMEVL